MRFSAASGHKVVSTSTAETVGKVDAFVVDPATRAVVALTLKKTDDGDTPRWSNITAFGADAVTVSGAEKVTRPPADVSPLLGKEHELVGNRVLSSLGDELGKIDDVDFDPASGAVMSLILSGEEVAGDRLVGVGRYAVVVKAG